MNQFLISQLGLVASEDASGIQALGIDPLAILAQGTTFLVLFFIIKKYALTKIVTSLNQRKEAIDKSLSLATEMEQQNAELEKKMARVLRDARLQADEALAKAKVEASELIKSAEAVAKRRADDILKDNEIRLKHEITSAKNELKAEVADLVSDATGAILRDSLSPPQERKLIEMYLKEVL